MPNLIENPSATDISNVPGRNLKQSFQAALTFSEFLDDVKENATLWRETYRLVRTPPDATERLASIPGTWHLLAIVEDWCGDAVNILPLLARLVESTANVDLRVVRRDEHPELMDAHLTNGTRSMPVVIVLDDSYDERAWWGPRPSQLQHWVTTEGKGLDKTERYRHVRTWYARDRGRSVTDEVINTIKRASEAVTPPAAA